MLGDLLGDRGGGAEGGTQLVERAFADRTRHVADEKEGNRRHSHDTEDGPEPVGPVCREVVVRIGLSGMERRSGSVSKKS